MECCSLTKVVLFFNIAPLPPLCFLVSLGGSSSSPSPTRCPLRLSMDAFEIHVSHHVTCIFDVSRMYLDVSRCIQRDTQTSNRCNFAVGHQYRKFKRRIGSSSGSLRCSATPTARPTAAIGGGTRLTLPCSVVRTVTVCREWHVSLLFMLYATLLGKSSGKIESDEARL